MKLLLFLFFPISLLGQLNWQQKSDLAGTARSGAMGFSINGKGYVTMGKIFPGSWNDISKDLWQYDPNSDVWSQKANFQGQGRWLGYGFSIGDKGYVGGGVDWNQQVYNDLWVYNPLTNWWTPKASLPGPPRLSAVFFVIDGYAYVGTGDNYNLAEAYADFYKYNPASDTWSQVANYPGGPTTLAMAFSIAGKGYVGTGMGESFLPPLKKDFYEYDPSSNNWIQKSDIPGSGRAESFGFGLNDKGYLSMGTTQISFGCTDDLLCYDPSNDSWTVAGIFPGGKRELLTGFQIDCKQYFVSGFINDTDPQKDLWVMDLGPCTQPEEPNEDITVPGYFIPNVFTPNGDLGNEVWGSNFIDENEYLIVMNRWGQFIVRLDLSNSEWNGTHEGKLCDDGVYYYTGMLRGEKKHGFFHLIR